jgi:hypothetical protein
MRRSAIALCVLGLAAGLGCRPPVGRLIEQRAYDQALCAAQGSRDSARELAYVAQRLDADARPRLHLYAVPRAELERSLGDAGRRLAEQAVLVRAVVAIDGVQVDDFRLHVTLVGPQGAAQSQPASVEVLAALVGETITSAPVASMLARQAALLSHDETAKGQETASVWLWPRPPEGELRLVIEWSYVEYSCAGRRPALRRTPLADAELGRTVEIPLPPGGDLESRLNAAFGDRMRLLSP